MDDERVKRIEGRRQEHEERRRERWERRRSDPIGAVIGALVLIWLGLVMLAAQNPELLRLGPFSVTWVNWWAFFIGGVGALLILQGLLRAVTASQLEFGRFRSCDFSRVLSGGLHDQSRDYDRHIWHLPKSSHKTSRD
jgi:hypothetical protein